MQKADDVSPKDLVVLIEEEEGRQGRLEFAAALAALWQAHLIATFVVARLDLNRHAGFAVGSGLARMLQNHWRQVARATTETREMFDALLSRHGLAGEWRISENESPEELMLHARHASLAIVGPPSRGDREMTTLGLLESVIVGSGRPTLLLPTNWPAERIARRIVIGWNGGREATRAIADAMPFLMSAEAVHLVVVPEAKAQGLYGPEPGADMARHLARHGVTVDLNQYDGTDAGSVLLDRCRSSDADMLVIGAVGRSRIGEFIFGGATRTILGNADIPVLLSR